MYSIQLYGIYRHGIQGGRLLWWSRPHTDVCGNAGLLWVALAALSAAEHVAEATHVAHAIFGFFFDLVEAG